MSPPYQGRHCFWQVPVSVDSRVHTCLQDILILFIFKIWFLISVLLSFQAERGHSEQQSSMVNKAYQTLMKPLSRGMYLLELHGVTLEEGETQNDPELLMVIMEINEQLADAKDLETVQKIGQENQEILDSLIKEIAEAFKNQDIKKAKDLMITLKYYANIVDKVKEHEREAIG